MPKLRRRLHRMAKKESTEEESEHDAGLEPDIHIKTEIVDIEETMDSSLPDITVERHESVDELRKVLNLPETRIQKMPLAIKSEESFATTSSHLSLGYPNAVQSSSHLLPQYFINTSQPSYQIQITNADNTIIGMPSLPENTGEPGQLNQPNPNAITGGQRCSMIEIVPQSIGETGIVINKVYRVEADHPLTQVCNTSNSIPLINASFSISGSQTISGLNRHQYSAMVKQGLREKISKKYCRIAPKQYSHIAPKQYCHIEPKTYCHIEPKKYCHNEPKRHHRIEPKKNISDINDLTLNIPYFKSIKYDPDLNFLLSLMPFLKSLSPSIRRKARAQIKEMILEPGQ